MMRAIAVFAALCLLTGTAQAQTKIHSGATLEPGCRYAAEETWESRPPGEAALAGICIGVVTAILATSTNFREPQRFCAPNDVTVSLGVKLLAAYLRSRPARLQQSIVTLATDAFREAWPCR